MENPSLNQKLSDFDPLSDDAPIVQLLSLRHKSFLKDMSTAELTKYLEEVKTLAQQPPTLNAKLIREANRSGDKVGATVRAQRKSILDSI